MVVCTKLANRDRGTTRFTDNRLKLGHECNYMRQEPCTQRAFFGGVKVEFSRGRDWDGVMDGKFPGTLSSRPIGAAGSLETALSTRFS